MSNQSGRPLRTLLDEAVDELNRAKCEITSPAEDRLIVVCDLLIQWLQEVATGRGV